MDEAGEIYYTDSVYVPEEQDDAEARPNSADSKKGGTNSDKPKRDFSNQKKMTQKLRTWIDRDQLIRITKSINKPKPGLLGVGVRRFKNDVNALTLIAPVIEKKVIGSGRLKNSDKKKLNQFRESIENDGEIEHLQAPWTLFDEVFDIDPESDNIYEEKENGDIFVYRRPGLDLHPATGSSGFAIRKSKPYQTAEELLQVIATIKKMDATINKLKLQELEEHMCPIIVKEPMEFEEPMDPEFTSARLRPLIKSPKRDIIRAELDFDPCTSEFLGHDPVAELASINADVNIDFTPYSDIRPEIMIQREMALRARMNGIELIDQIISAAESVKFGKKKAADEHEIMGLNKGRRKSEVNSKFAESIKMVIKRLPQNSIGPKTKEPTYEITKKNEKESKKRAKAQVDSVAGESKLKRPRKSNNDSMDAGPKAKRLKTVKNE